MLIQHCFREAMGVVDTLANHIFKLHEETWHYEEFHHPRMTKAKMMMDSSKMPNFRIRQVKILLYLGHDV